MPWTTYLQKPGFRSFLQRTALFLLLFIALSFAVGSVIVGTPLLYTLGFFVYGGAGYVLLAMAVFFVVYARQALLKIRSYPRANHWLLAASAACLAGFIYVGKRVAAAPSILAGHVFWYGALLHGLFLASIVLLGLSIFSVAFIRGFLVTFRKQLLVCLCIALIFYAAMRVVWLSWPILSFGVARMVYWLLHLTYADAALIPPQSIAVHGFTVYIGEACSGVYSIFLFTCLYLLIIALDWKRLHHGRAVGMFFVAVAGLFLVNVLRVYLILLVGIYTSVDFAVNLFHSYIGSILFIAYFIGFLYLTYGWMNVRRTKRGGPRA